jgi:alkanesulfonate monooxygenase SsuD/methylene tetrahydromethanopterin reductase-like flavin-dependent oxidoreductase (luciferase family)
MATAIMRLNFIQPGLEPTEMSARYKAGLDMAKFAEDNDFMAITFEEHHGADNGWSLSPLITAGAVFSRTSRIAVSISALLVPLHDPLRIAEDIAVLACERRSPVGQRHRLPPRGVRGTARTGHAASS